MTTDAQSKLVDNIRLSLTKLKPDVVIMLLEKFGSASDIFSTTPEILREKAELTDRALVKLFDSEAKVQAQGEAEFIKKYSLRALFYGEQDYPNRLLSCFDAPPIIYVKGTVEFNCSDDKWISIVGTRKATQLGLENCDKIVQDIAEHYPSAIIVSGLAYGIDVAAHRAAMRYGLRTVAVMAQGLDTIYPASHREVALEILSKGGAIISEFPSKTILQKPYFLQRNRIVAGLSDAVFVVESSARGGSLVTANIANSYDREVFACPGRIVDKTYEGNNILIKNNKATLYQDITDLTYIMDWEPALLSPRFNLSLNETEKAIYDIFPNKGEITAEEIVEKTELTFPLVLSYLTAMEVNGIIKSVKARMYIKL